MGEASFEQYERILANLLDNAGGPLRKRDEIVVGAAAVHGVRIALEPRSAFWANLPKTDAVSPLS